MPHIAVKIASGQSDEAKTNLATALTKAMSASLECDESLISVSIEDVERSNWLVDVYQPDIEGKSDKLYKRPGYDPYA